MSTTTGKLANGSHSKQDRSNLIPFSSRLKEGRALAQDVWSIFKCVYIPHHSSTDWSDPGMFTVPRIFPQTA